MAVKVTLVKTKLKQNYKQKSWVERKQNNYTTKTKKY